MAAAESGLETIVLIRAGAWRVPQHTSPGDEPDRLSGVCDCTGRRFVLLAKLGDELVAGF